MHAGIRSWKSHTAFVTRYAENGARDEVSIPFIPHKTQPSTPIVMTLPFHKKGRHVTRLDAYQCGIYTPYCLDNRPCTRPSNFWQVITRKLYKNNHTECHRGRLQGSTIQLMASNSRHNVCQNGSTCYSMITHSISIPTFCQLWLRTTSLEQRTVLNISASSRFKPIKLIQPQAAD